ncbi:hypothetical protein FRB91_006783 [Serendipita sp. 411]|nr:hypothetical protein FRC19_005196 [Serendipita sp. 401]KAG8839786.1 hypothetical protein FRB91_006783 [Serendipita sp. 411]
MLRREPTLIQIDQDCVKDVKAFLLAKATKEAAETDGMVLDVIDGTAFPRTPFNAVEDDKKKRAVLTRNQRVLGIAD